MKFHCFWKCCAALAVFAAVLAAQSAPIITNNSFPPATVGQAYSQALNATGGTPPYSWSGSGQLPPGLSVASVGVLSGTPTSGGSFNFTLTVFDARQATNSKIFTIVVGGSSSRLSVTTTSLPSGTVGQSYSQTLSAAGGTPPYTWAAVVAQIPAGLALASNGTISGTPATAGTASIPVQVTDTAGATATGTVTLTINPAPLVITTQAPLFTGTVGVAYVQTFHASGGTPPYTWSITSGSTGDLSLDPATGNLAGTPQTAGTLNFTVQVTDKAGVTASQAYSLTINAPVLTITVGAALPAATANVGYSQKVPVTANGGTPPYTWSIAAGSSLPAGLSFDPNSLTISGTPTTAGSFNFTIQVSDSAGATATRSLALTVNAASLSITTSRQLPDGTLNQVYALLISATGGQTPYRWSASGLPAGLSINASTGQISGTPTAAGTFGVAITVTDSALANFSDRFTLNINLPPAPGVTFSGLPSTVSPAQQYTLQVSLSAPFPAPITGQAILTFSPDTGPADRTIQFASGGTTASFNIATGNTTPDAPIALQTGTVSGTINISLRLQAGGIDITPSPAPTISAQIVRAAPVIRSVQVNRSGSTLSLVVTGYSTAREVTQAVFAFNAASGSSLQAGASSISVDMSTLFGNWFQDPNNGQFGSVFVLTQPFTIQGDVNAVIPTSVTLTNRVGSASSTVQ
jgi:Putative Ig domain